MGRGSRASHSSSQTPAHTTYVMGLRELLLLAVLAVSATAQESDVDTSIFTAYTKSDSGCLCWWDLTRDDCACCNDGDDIVQCGYPMHNYCYMKHKREGCPGVPNSKYTLSTKGFSCYWDKNRRNDCAWCAVGGMQCGKSKKTKPDSKLGNHCHKGKNRRYCDAIIGDCRHIPHACDPNAECVFSTKFGKGMRVYKCECKDGYTGNGVQCFDQDGNLSSNNMETVELEMSINTDFYVYPHQSEEFPFGAEMDAVFDDMNSLSGSCNGNECSASVTGL